MSNLLKEYIELLIEATSTGQSSLSASKIIGYAAEWATWEGCGGRGGFKFATEEDRRIVPIWDATPDKRSRTQFRAIYDSMVQEAKSAVAGIRKKSKLTLSSPRKPDEGTATEKVDIVTADADIHVKFNDAVRLAGFQRAKTGAPASRTSKVYDSVMKKFGSSLGVDSRFVDAGGFLRRPGGVKGMSKMSSTQKAAAMKLQNEFQQARDQYRTAFTNSSGNLDNPGQREDFIDALDAAGIREAILDDIKQQLLGKSGRATIYFKYFSESETSARLETHQYDLSDMIVTPIESESTKFYQVTSDDESKVYFQIEFRMDGGGHPPQLKVGKDLDAAVE